MTAQAIRPCHLKSNQRFAYLMTSLNVKIKEQQDKYASWGGTISRLLHASLFVHNKCLTLAACAIIPALQANQLWRMLVQLIWRAWKGHSPAETEQFTEHEAIQFKPTISLEYVKQPPSASFRLERITNHWSCSPKPYNLKMFDVPEGITLCCCPHMLGCVFDWKAMLILAIPVNNSTTVLLPFIQKSSGPMNSWETWCMCVLCFDVCDSCLNNSTITIPHDQAWMEKLFTLGLKSIYSGYSLCTYSTV